jgi:hypothetical protein
MSTTGFSCSPIIQFHVICRSRQQRAQENCKRACHCFLVHFTTFFADFICRYVKLGRTVHEGTNNKVIIDVYSKSFTYYITVLSSGIYLQC